ncbi:MAG: hypothetical protein AB1700_12560, partial [Bacillota bacterium]
MYSRLLYYIFQSPRRRVKVCNEYQGNYREYSWASFSPLVVGSRSAMRGADFGEWPEHKLSVPSSSGQGLQSLEIRPGIVVSE